MKTWFEQLFGFKESLFPRGRLLENFVLNIDPNGQSTLFCKANAHTFNIGRFTTPSLMELRDEFNRSIHMRARQASALDSSNYRDSGIVVRHEAIADIIELHASATGPAVFQAASQFNCLEFPQPGCIPEDGITEYIYDDTQGPACAIAAAAGTLFRNYFLPMPWKNSYEASVSDCLQYGQSVGCQINNFDGTEKYLQELGYQPIHIRNGYSFASAEELLRLNSFLGQNEWCHDEIRQRIKVGIHESVEVLFSSRDSILPHDGSTHRIVTQVYCSAFSCGYSGISNDIWEPMAQLLLDAIYEATLLSAILRKPVPIEGTPTAYLTFVGGGVFGNNMSWIASSIARAVKSLRSRNMEILDKNELMHLNVVICHRSIREDIRLMIDQAINDT
jgi:hypothetical protein